MDANLKDAMQRIRNAEEAIAGMVESGEAVCPCHLAIGQEAIAVGVCAALRPEDTIWGNHRSHAHFLAKGGSIEGLLAQIRQGQSMHLSAPEIGIPGTIPIVAGSVPLAAGAALAYKLRGESRVAVAFFGDGAFEQGVLHETLNLAALYSLPIVFVCENNFYASHMHWSERRLLDNLVEAGRFHGVPACRIDGNDVQAVLAAATEAVGRARSGGGPTLLECRTFRHRGHVGPAKDDDVGLTRREDLTTWLAKDPLACAN